MARKLPPLRAVRAYEAAARLGSFTKAAAELFVSPAAISQQIKILEDHFETQLFHRQHSQIALTDAGKAYLPMVVSGLDQICAAGHRLSSLKPATHLTVSALPSVASKWLALNLLAWCEQNPEIDIRVIAQHREVDFQAEEVDFRICYGNSSYPNLNVSKLFLDEVYPVCCPEFMAGEYALSSPENLKDHTLLHVSWGEENRTLPNWAEWLRAADCGDLDGEKGPEFNLSSIAIRAAMEGKGVMLGQGMLVAEDLAAGRLVRPFDLSLPLLEGYYLVYPDEVLSKTYSSSFIEWVHNLAAAK